jgi:hypothetical protein
MKKTEDYTMREITEANNHTHQAAIDVAYKFFDFLNDTFGGVDGAWKIAFHAAHPVKDTYMDSLRKDYSVMFERKTYSVYHNDTETSERLLLNSESLETDPNKPRTVAKPLPSILRSDEKTSVY